MPPMFVRLCRVASETEKALPGSCNTAIPGTVVKPVPPSWLTGCTGSDVLSGVPAGAPPPLSPPPSEGACDAWSGDDEDDDV